MKVRVCYEDIEEIYECEDMAEAVDLFVSAHDVADVEEMTVTEVGSFYDRNR